MIRLVLFLFFYANNKYFIIWLFYCILLFYIIQRVYVNLFLKFILLYDIICSILSWVLLTWLHLNTYWKLETNINLSVSLKSNTEIDNAIHSYTKITQNAGLKSFPESIATKPYKTNFPHHIRYLLAKKKTSPKSLAKYKNTKWQKNI